MDTGTFDVTRSPLGTSDFRALRQFNQIYVDKTDLICDLASLRGKIFLSRPRRFGKSLLVSTFETLFKDGLKHFGGLRIDGQWKDTAYGVAKLDLSEMKDKNTIEKMGRAFDGLLRTAFEDVGFVHDPVDGRTCLEQLASWLKKQEPNGLVLLVDEYDAPLNSHLDDPVFFDEIRDLLSGFFSLVKAADRVWRFVFITGIAKFNKASIFSAFNNLTDISLDPDYGTLLGYTEEEILENFGPFVEHAAQVNGMDVPALMAAMRAQYDGFCFDEAASTHVYAPWSVLSFLDRPRQGLRNFWYGSAGRSSLILNYLKGRSFGKDIDRFGEGVSVALDDLRQTNDLDTLAPEVFLFQAGYLSIKRIDRGNALLDFPNGEVRFSMNRVMADRILRSRKFAPMDQNAWGDALESGDVDGLVAAMNGTFDQIDYEGYPLTRESHVRAAVQITLLALGFGVDVERHNAKGRSDLEFDAGAYRWVLEFKYARKGDDPGKLLGDALVQIRDKRYGEGADGRTRLRVGLVFDGQERRFVRYEVV